MSTKEGITRLHPFKNIELWYRQHFCWPFQIETRHVCKIVCPLKCCFVTDILNNRINQFKISCTHVWRWNSFSKLLLKRFWYICPGDLDLWPSDPKIKSVPLPSMTDVWTKFEGGKSMRYMPFLLRKGHNKSIYICIHLVVYPNIEMHTHEYTWRYIISKLYEKV